MLDVQCRLCSSTTALISLFSGKCRKNRDFIRKMIDITTGIKFEKNDGYRCICLACAIQIYNFYLFRTRSVENGSRLLKEISKNSEKIRSHKIEILCLDEIELPDIEELKGNLASWFISKQAQCEFDSHVQHSNSNILQKSELVDGSTQYDSVKYFEKNTQCEISTSEAYVQTNKITTKNKILQVDDKHNDRKECGSQTLGDQFKVDKVTQCECSHNEVGTQTNKLITKTSKIQCNLIKRDKADTNNFKVQCELLRAGDVKNDITKYTTETVDKTTQCLFSTAEMGIQTYTPKTEFLEIQCGLICNNSEMLTNKKCITQINNPEREDLKTENETKYDLNRSKICLRNKRPTTNIKHYSKSRNKSLNALNNVKYNSIQEEHNLSNVEMSTSINQFLSTVPKNEPSMRQKTFISTETQCELLNSEKSVVNILPSNVKTQGMLRKRGRKSFSKQMFENEHCNKLDKGCQCDIPNKPYNRQLPAERPMNDNGELLYEQNILDSACYKQADILVKTILKQEDSNNQSICNTPSSSSTINSLSVNVNSTENELLASPYFPYTSPRSSNLLTIKKKSENVIICPECDQTMYSKIEHKLHKKTHMKCNFCKKKFTSLKKAKMHIVFDCELQKITKSQPFIDLIRLEYLDEIKKTYPHILAILKEYNQPESTKEYKNEKKIRLRSRSISDIESIINCTSYRGGISVLRNVTIGVDKSIQVNFTFDNLVMPSFELIYKSICLKRNLDDNPDKNDGCQKKIKLSPIDI